MDWLRATVVFKVKIIETECDKLLSLENCWLIEIESLKED